MGGSKIDFSGCIVAVFNLSWSILIFFGKEKEKERYVRY